MKAYVVPVEGDCEVVKQGDDFREDYFSGVYDVRCEECGGDNVVWRPDEHNNPPEAIAAFHENERFLAEMEAERRAELRMGC